MTRNGTVFSVHHQFQHKRIHALCVQTYFNRGDFRSAMDR